MLVYLSHLYFCFILIYQFTWRCHYLWPRGTFCLVLFTFWIFNNTVFPDFYFIKIQSLLVLFHMNCENCKLYKYNEPCKCILKYRCWELYFLVIFMHTVFICYRSGSNSLERNLGVKKLDSIFLKVLNYFWN